LLLCPRDPYSRISKTPWHPVLTVTGKSLFPAPLRLRHRAGGGLSMRDPLPHWSRHTPPRV